MIEQIRSNRRKILWGIAAYIILVVCVAGLLSAVMFRRYGADLAWIFLAVFVLLDICAVWFATSSGMRLMLWLLHATPVYRGGFQPVQDALDNMVIASGLPAPELMFIDDDSCNAFSLKRGNRMMIFFTHGLAKTLDPDELNAVMGHEMAHLHNGDAALNALIISLSGFTVLAGYLLRQLTTSENRGVIEGGIVDTLKTWAFAMGVSVLFLLFIFIPISYLRYPEGIGPLPGQVLMIWSAFPLALISLLLAVLLGTVMRMLINPAREMLADELCVKWTMHPEGLVRAMMEASCHATKYSFKTLRSTWFVPCHFNDPQPRPLQRIAYLEETLHLKVGNRET